MCFLFRDCWRACRSTRSISTPRFPCCGCSTSMRSSPSVLSRGGGGIAGGSPVRWRWRCSLRPHALTRCNSSAGACMSRRSTSDRARASRCSPSAMVCSWTAAAAIPTSVRAMSPRTIFSAPVSGGSTRWCSRTITPTMPTVWRYCLPASASMRSTFPTLRRRTAKSPRCSRSRSATAWRSAM